MVACLRAGEHFFPTCACPAQYNVWARSSRLETRTKESSTPASSLAATIHVCATKILAGICAPATNFSLMGSLSVSTPARTRKMVSYACGRQTQVKLRWKPVAVLTCKSFVIYGYGGERLIEPSSSWFPPKFSSG